MLVLATLVIAPAAMAQSPALKNAARQTVRLLDLGKYAEAEVWAQKAVKLAQQEFGVDDPTYALTLHNLALVYDGERRYREVEPLEKRALAIYEKAPGPHDHVMAVSLNVLADFYRTQSRYGDAEAAAERAVALDSKLHGPEDPDIVAELVGLAGIYDDEGRYGDAETLFKRALAIDEKALGRDDPDLATDINNLAALYFDQGRYGDAEPLLERALEINEKAYGGDSPQAALSLNNLGEVYSEQGRFGDAETLFKRAVAIDDKKLRSSGPDLAASLDNLAGLYRVLGRVDDAEPLFKRALAIDEKALDPNSPDLATDLSNLAILYVNERRFSDAEPLDKRALAIDEKTFGPDHPAVAICLNNLANLYDDQGRYADAEPLYRRALAIDEKALGPDHPDLAVGLSNLAYFYANQSRYAEARPFVERAVAIHAGRAASRTEIGKGQRSEQRLSRPVFVQAVDITTHLLAAGSAEAARLREEGFAALQWSKASDTAAAVGHMAARFATGSDALAALVRNLQDARDRLEAIEKRLLTAASQAPAKRDAAAEDRLRGQAAMLRQDLEKRDADLAAKFPAYVELANPKPIAIAEVQSLLAPDEGLIAFSLGAKESYVATVGHDRYDIKIVPVGSKALADAVKTLRGSLGPTDQNEVPPFEASAAYKLYQQLLAPVEASLQDIKRLYVVTDGALDSLPLGVLLTAPPAAETLSEAEALRAAPWLAKRYAVSVLPSISSLKALRQFARGSPAGKPFFGIGDPLLKDHPPAGDKARGGKALALARGVAIKTAFRGDRVDTAQLRDLPSLPETADELEAEAKLFKAGEADLLLRGGATVTAVKHADLSDRRVIAFATHGLLAGDVGAAEPGLVMTPPANPTPEDDGLLKTSEIAQLKLNADLVILSACNTAASDGTPGAEGFSGLAKAFLYAGARSLLVSHWEVVSASTVGLMTGMSRHMEEQGVGRAEALRLAMLDLMNDHDHPAFAHPLFWAPFVVVGDGG
jgi:CHAT domain-containing protein/tetratricopeptide (TPR) repeat protein